MLNLNQWTKLVAAAGLGWLTIGGVANAQNAA